MQLEATATKTGKPSWRTIANLYRDGLRQVFGCGDADLDADLIKALERDVHKGADAPGGWSPSSILEIYCEGGIPNASDIESFEWEDKVHFYYASERWDKVDQYVNQTLRLMGYPHQVYYEPYNGAVVSVNWN
jgi:hypothetical protein